jgi:hypothetical protein
VSKSDEPQVNFDQNWAKNLEVEYEDYMWNCESTVDGEEEDDFTTLSGQPFCGCQTCYTREQLMFLIPRIAKALKEGLLTLEE